jgi:hypothetical protein
MPSLLFNNPHEVTLTPWHYFPQSTSDFRAQVRRFRRRGQERTQLDSRHPLSSAFREARNDEQRNKNKKHYNSCSSNYSIAAPSFLESKIKNEVGNLSVSCYDVNVQKKKTRIFKSAMSFCLNLFKNMITTVQLPPRTLALDSWTRYQ